MESVKIMSTNKSGPLYPEYLLPRKDAFGRRRIIMPLSYRRSRRIPTNTNKSTMMPNNYQRLYGLVNGHKVKLRLDDDLMSDNRRSVVQRYNTHLPQDDHLYSRRSRQEGKYIPIDSHSEWDR